MKEKNDQELFDEENRKMKEYLEEKDLCDSCLFKNKPNFCNSKNRPCIGFSGMPLQ